MRRTLTIDGVPAVNAEVPFKRIGNHLVIDDYTLAEQPWLEEFMTRFAHCFERKKLQYCYVFWPQGVPVASKSDD